MKISNETKVGILVTISVLIFIWGFNYLKGSPLFLKTQDFYAVYERIDGIGRGAPVLISGYTVGKVENLEMITKGQKIIIVLRFSIKNDIYIPSNSVARIHSSDILGSKAIELIMGDSPVYANMNDTLLSDIEIGLSESVNKVLAPVKERAENLITSVDSVVSALETIIKAIDVEKVYHSIEASLTSIENITKAMDEMVAGKDTRVQRIFTNIERITEGIAENRNKFDNIINNFSSISDTLAALEMYEILNNAEKTLKQLSEILENINKGEGTLGLLVNDEQLYLNLESSSRNLDELLHEMKSNPFRYFNISLINFGRGSKENNK